MLIRTLVYRYTHLVTIESTKQSLYMFLMNFCNVLITLYKPFVGPDFSLRQRNYMIHNCAITYRSSINKFNTLQPGVEKAVSTYSTFAGLGQHCTKVRVKADGPTHMRPPRESNKFSKVHTLFYLH